MYRPDVFVALYGYRRDPLLSEMQALRCGGNYPQGKSANGADPRLQQLHYLF
jgi:hypothetical protein